jgi:hypothetical protein
MNSTVFLIAELYDLLVSNITPSTSKTAQSAGKDLSFGPIYALLPIVL